MSVVAVSAVRQQQVLVFVAWNSLPRSSKEGLSVEHSKIRRICNWVCGRDRNDDVRLQTGYRGDNRNALEKVIQNLSRFV